LLIFIWSLAMPNFLLSIEYNLETTLLAAAISFVLTSVLVWLMMLTANRSRLNQLRISLEKEMTASEQQRMQLGAELNNLQQKIKQTETKVTEKTAQITELEKYTQSVQAELEKNAALQIAVNQKNQEFSQLNQRLQASEKNQTALQQAQQTWQADREEKDIHIKTLTTTLDRQSVDLQEQAATLDEQASKVVALEQTLQQQQAELAQAQQINLNQQQQLENTMLQVQDLQQRLTEQTVTSLWTENQQQPFEQPSLAQLEERNQALERKLLENQQLIDELQAVITTQTEQRPPVVIESELSKMLASQTAKITQLNATLAEQANYLFRLEYDLDVKKALISHQNSPLQSIPAALVAKQEQALARIDELEQLLNSKRKIVEKSAEKIYFKPLELLNPAKQQLEEIADKAKYLPIQFKAFYQKILPKNSNKFS
jgi:hypothetical protein